MCALGKRAYQFCGMLPNRFVRAWKARLPILWDVLPNRFVRAWKARLPVLWDAA